MSRKNAWLAAVLLMAATIPARAQGTTGTVTGTVSDSSGAVIAGAQVRLINTGTGVVQKTSTNQNGDYRFLLVPPGMYAVEAESGGFKTFRRDGIIVEVNRSLAVPITLEVGAITERVEIKGGTPLLEPNTSALGTVMDSRKVEDLPLNGRNPLGLANLIPTVQGIGYFGGEILSTWRMGQVVIAGGTPLNNGFLIDGIANEKMTDYSAMAFLPVDATQEFKVISNNMSAEYGRTGGGIISFISKSGTNQFHGLLFEYLRNTDLNSNEFFSNKAGSPRPPVHINTFGGTFGGPIKKDKLFFFVNLEAYRERRAAFETITSPTTQQRAGDFSSTFTSAGAPIIIYDPRSTVPDPARAGQYIRTPFGGNKIPSTSISPIASAILKFYPMPNLPGLPNSGAQNLFLEGPTPIDKNNVGIRLDYNLTPTKRISGRFNRDTLDWGFTNYFGNIADVDGRHILDPRRTAVVEYTDTLTPTLLLDARIGVNREQEHTVAPGHNFDVTSIGFSQLYASQIQQGELGVGFPSISITDFTGFGRPDSTGNPTATGTANAIVTKIRNTHTIKAGYEQRLYRRSDWGTSNSSGAYGFSRGFTQGPNPLVATSNGGYGLATFLLGTPTSGSAGITSDTVDTMNYSALFVQDDWKASRKLTLNLGLRWEYEGPVKERRNIFPNFDPDVPSALKVPGLNLRGGYTFPGTSGIPNGVTDPNYKNFGPRLGFAYQLHSKTVVRGGYGISYIPTFGLGGSAAGAGFSVNTSMVASLDGGLTPANTLANPFPNGLIRPSGSSLGTLTSVGQGATAGQLRYVYRGYAQEWNFTVQHEPWANWLFEAAYVGNKGTHLTMTGQNLNQLPDQYIGLGTQLINTVTNPFYGNPAITSGTLAAATVTQRQLLLPFPQFLSATTSNYLGDSIYHAFTFKVEKRFSTGFSLLASYTASKLIDDMQSTGRPGAIGGTGVQDWYNLHGERARSYQDLPQRFVATATWEIPYKPANSILRTIAGGWQTNGIWTWQSGRPIALSAPTTGINNRPNAVPGASHDPAHQSLAQWFNTTAFTQPAPYTYGNVSRTLPDINGPRFFDIDASIFKTFPITERFKLQFRAEAYNLTNTPSLDVPVGSLNSATFGFVTATMTPAHTREMQFALRLSF